MGSRVELMGFRDRNDILNIRSVPIYFASGKKNLLGEGELVWANLMTSRKQKCPPDCKQYANVIRSEK